MLCICVFAGTPVKFTPGGNKAVLMKDTTNIIATRAYALAHGVGSSTVDTLTKIGTIHNEAVLRASIATKVANTTTVNGLALSVNIELTDSVNTNFTGVLTFAKEKRFWRKDTVDANITMSVNLDANARLGNTCSVILVGDGTHTFNKGSFIQVGVAFNNTAGTKNLMIFTRFPGNVYTWNNFILP